MFGWGSKSEPEPPSPIMSETLDPGPTTDFSASSFQSEPTASMGGDAELQVT